LSGGPGGENFENLRFGGEENGGGHTLLLNILNNKAGGDLGKKDYLRDGVTLRCGRRGRNGRGGWRKIVISSLNKGGGRRLRCAAGG